MAINADLELMKADWKNLEIEEEFPAIHHFSCEQFKADPPSLNDFYNWCQNNEIKDENLQTLNRANKAASLINQGYAVRSSITAAWAAFQLVEC